MEALWSWFKIGLVLGGVLVAMVGLIWYKTVNLTRFFGSEANPDKGIWVMMSGLAMLGIGMALFYFNL
jgi:hypothetical protein